MAVLNLVKVVVVTGEVEMEVVLKVAGGSLPSIRGSTMPRSCQTSPPQISFYISPVQLEPLKGPTLRQLPGLHRLR